MYRFKPLPCVISLLLLLTFSMAKAESLAKGVETRPAAKHQEGWFYGLLMMVKAHPYKGIHNDALAVPVIGYKGEKFSWTGPKIEYQLLDSSHFEGFVELEYRSDGLDPSDSSALTGVRKRKDPFMGGGAIKFKNESFKLELSHLADLVSVSNGSDTRIKAAYRYNVGPVFFTPALSLSFLDADYANYYFGTSDNEFLPNHSPYAPGPSLNKSAELAIATPIFFNGFSRLAITRNWIADEIRKSPLVDNSQSWRVMFTFSRFF